ncbi:hypothetical protein SEMRO_778_G201140.1 [Seminavis robusta]|uniref:Uncharacterized protein n=1 Tax=Seminavis robusta TaxID=568900 RepID=A0A9N8E9N4_9STRA|nr:hypothetical protein SEMRO_778_G201140.1 [Seminavis robusta]|eukprot:Sro778_g201140.1 n/a (332) ;mRNA; r:20725-21720
MDDYDFLGLLTQDVTYQSEYVGHNQDFHAFGTTFFQHGHGRIPVDLIPPSLAPRQPLKESTNTFAGPMKVKKITAEQINKIFSPLPQRKIYKSTKRGPTPVIGRTTSEPPKKKADVIPSPVKRLNNELSSKEKVGRSRFVFGKKKSLFENGEAFMYCRNTMSMNKGTSHKSGKWQEAQEAHVKKSKVNDVGLKELLDLAEQEERDVAKNTTDSEKKSEQKGEEGSMKQWLKKHGELKEFRLKPMPPPKKKAPLEYPRGTKGKIDNTMKLLRPIIGDHYKANPKILKIPVEDIVQKINQCYIELSAEAKEIPSQFKPKNKKAISAGGGTTEE